MRYAPELPERKWLIPKTLFGTDAAAVALAQAIARPELLAEILAELRERNHQAVIEHN